MSEYRYANDEQLFVKMTKQLAKILRIIHQIMIFSNVKRYSLSNKLKVQGIDVGSVPTF